MTRYVAMLRGVNVGGRTRLAMADLRRVVADLGHDDVESYIQSGNVVFGSRAAASGLGPAIERHLEQELGLTVSVLVRSHAQLTDVLSGNPLSGPGRDPSRLHVTFLSARPAPGRSTAIDADAYRPDEFVARGREVYVHCPNGYGRTKLTNTFFERALGVSATTRNLKTVVELARRSS
ncbi:MAG: DUF1697 domain-containing protein [Acidimicrobiales bacterium]